MGLDAAGNMDRLAFASRRHISQRSRAVIQIAPEALAFSRIGWGGSSEGGSARPWVGLRWRLARPKNLIHAAMALYPMKALRIAPCACRIQRNDGV
jgi:hypothetical protein